MRRKRVRVVEVERMEILSICLVISLVSAERRKRRERGWAWREDLEGGRISRLGMEGKKSRRRGLAALSFRGGDH